MAWSTEQCASAPRTILALLIETAKISRLSSLRISFRVAFFSTLWCIIYTKPRERDILLYRSTTDHYFSLNATPWHRATLLSRSAIACVVSVSVLFRSKDRGTRVKDRAKNGVSKRAGRGHPVAKSDTTLSVHERSFFFNATLWHRATPFSCTATGVIFLFLMTTRSKVSPLF